MACVVLGWWLLTSAVDGILPDGGLAIVTKAWLGLGLVAIGYRPIIAAIRTTWTPFPWILAILLSFGIGGAITLYLQPKPRSEGETTPVTASPPTETLKVKAETLALDIYKFVVERWPLHERARSDPMRTAQLAQLEYQTRVRFNEQYRDRIRKITAELRRAGVTTDYIDMLIEHNGDQTVDGMRLMADKLLALAQQPMSAPEP